MLLRDRLLARMREMGETPDHVRLAAEVLGIREGAVSVRVLRALRRLRALLGDDLLEDMK